MAYKRSSTADRHEGMRNPVEIPTAPDRPFQRLISPGGARSKSLGCPKTGHWFIGFRELSLYSTESLPKAKRAGLSQGEIRLFGYSFSSKSNRTAVKPIPHKPRFHAGLRAVRQSNGFIVGNTPPVSSSGFITPCTVEKVPFSQGFSNFLDSIVCPPVPSGSGQKL